MDTKVVYKQSTGGSVCIKTTTDENGNERSKQLMKREVLESQVKRNKTQIEQLQKQIEEVSVDLAGWDKAEIDKTI